MKPWAFLGAAAALAVERAVYVWVARHPDRFRDLCARPLVTHLGGPVAVVGALFSVFKLVQLAVFVGWCHVFGGALIAADADYRAFALGGAFLIVGQTLNWSVFYRLGAVGVFYGDRLGHDVPWCRAFPFSVCSHPQYVGAVLSIWGLFLATRFPHDDWVLIPALETVYYAVSTTLEERRLPSGTDTQQRSAAASPATALFHVRARRAVRRKRIVRPVRNGSRRHRSAPGGAQAGGAVVEASRGPRRSSA